jgi:L-fuconate dehydratase
MSNRFVELSTYDVRFPTSRQLDGSDAMNPDPDYSAAYVVLRTDAVDGHEGHGFAFTIGRGNEVQTAAILALRPYIVGRLVKEVLDDLGGLWRELVHDSQLRWLGPEKGVMHMAISAVVNALWDLKAKRAGLPLWQLLSSMHPEELVELVDFRYLTDALTPKEALELLRPAAEGREERIATLLAEGYPAYATSPGWLGYDDEKLTRLCREALDAGFTQIKLKVGADLDDDLRRMRTAVEWVRALAPFHPWWVEEPTSPDDVVGHAEIARRIAPVPVATGEHVQNRVVFKQLLQLNAVSFVQLDAARVAGVNENVAILLLAAKFGIPVCPHAGGVGLCELVQHLSMFDYVAVSRSMRNRVIEYVDHLHEHFADPVRLRGGRYLAPLAPGFSSTMRAESIARYAFPDGPIWNPDTP